MDWYENLEIRERVETIQTTAFFRLARILRKVWRLEKTCCHSNTCEKPVANAGGEKKLEKEWYMHNPAPVLENATHKLLSE